MKRHRGSLVVLSLATAFVLHLLGPSWVQASLVINPTFDSTITNDPNAVAIEGTINTAIRTYESTFSNNITVNITFQEMTTGLGRSNFTVFIVPYTRFRAALAAQPQTSDVATALAHLPNQTNNPVTNTANVLLKTADIKALGLTGFSLPASDGTVSLNTTITTPGSPGTTGQYSLLATTEHEIDEILGLGSTLVTFTSPPFSDDPLPEDLYRYDASGNRSFSTNPVSSTAPKAYFSLDGSTLLAQFNNQNNGGDYGDWQSNPRPPGVPPQVQDAFATPGAAPTLGVELRALNVVGYDFVTPEPSTIAAGGTGVLMALGSWLHRRRCSAG
jgi:hypothetical protein